jgi:exopolyphosphatase/guanosine-5'-triphosphate,3'-diphosphate pyrophosphatase
MRSIDPLLTEPTLDHVAPPPVIFFKPRPFDTVAAVDLGSNSFHMIVARPRDGGVDIIDRLREMVRLGGGLDAENRIAQETSTAALACLERFGQRLRHMPPGSVRVVGTNTLRKAADADEFLKKAETALGHPIEVISGFEEARLIYLGVAHDIADDGERRLVMDIGGGSTELTIGERFDPLHMRSLHMGCISHSQKYFPDMRVTRKRWRKAELAARMELEPHEAIYRVFGWSRAIGTSGTIRAVGRVVRENGWSEHGIGLEALRRLVDALVDGGDMNTIDLPGLAEERRPVFAGGVAILLATFDAMGIEHMQVAEGALREGVIYDLMGRIRHEDVRGHTVSTLARRYEVDTDQAARVRETVAELYKRTSEAWSLEADEARDLLNWAADLHEMGLQIARSGYHKHGAYILDNADLPGFSRQEQHLLSLLVRSHRRKMPVALFVALPKPERRTVQRLVVLLRLAVLLHRSRSPQAWPMVAVEAQENSLYLEFPAGWLDDHALTRADLDQEAVYLQAIGLELVFS